MNAKTLIVGLCVLSPVAALAQDSSQAVHGMRVRWGVNSDFGWFIPASAVDFGVAARVGVQMNDAFGLFLDFGAMAGIGASVNVTSTGGGGGISIVDLEHLAPMAELDLGKFFLAGGPMLARGGWAQVGEGVDVRGAVYQYAVAAGGVMPGLDLRTGFTFGQVEPVSGRHTGFTLALDVKLMYATVTSVGQAAGGAGASQSIKTGDHVFGITPMLMLGYDSK